MQALNIDRFYWDSFSCFNKGIGFLELAIAEAIKTLLQPN